MDKIDLKAKLAGFDEAWSPRIVAELNDNHVKLAKLRGEFIFHQHEGEDELFLVLAGRLLMRFRDREVWLEPGELLVVPKGVEHCPVAPEEAHVLMIEPKTTVNTGNLRNERTVEARWA